MGSGVRSLQRCSVVSKIFLFYCVNKDGIACLVTAREWVPTVQTGWIGICDDGKLLGGVEGLLLE